MPQLHASTHRTPILGLAALGCLVLTACSQPGALRIEAESAVLFGQTRVAEIAGDTPSKKPSPRFVTDFKSATDGIDLTVHAPSSGDYFLDLVYSTDGDKYVPISVNGGAQGSRRFSKTKGFEDARYGRVALNAGDNIIRIGTDWGYVDLDAITITPAPAPKPFHLSKTPVNPHASPEARTLFTLLTQKFGHSTFAGQHDSGGSEEPRLSLIARLTEDAAPAILGLDLIYYSHAWGKPNGDGAIEKALDWAQRRHGIVTLSWHWLAPDGLSDPAWNSFWTNKTAFDVSRVADKKSPEYALLVRDIDRIAEKLKILRDARVPVLWRPLHEAEGGWFWWGARGPEATRQLYRLMFERFTRVHHLDNLLWVWTSSDNSNARAWYPGDRYVDIIAHDLYTPAGTQGSFATSFDQLRERYHGKKPLALGECGAIPSINASAPWLWFLVWDDYIARADANPASSITRTYADPRIITLGRLNPTP